MGYTNTRVLKVSARRLGRPKEFTHSPNPLEPTPWDYTRTLMHCQLASHDSLEFRPQFFRHRDSGPCGFLTGAVAAIGRSGA